MGSLPQISPLDVLGATGVGGVSYLGGNESPERNALLALMARPAARSLALSPMVQNKLIQQPSKPNDLARLLMMKSANQLTQGE
jgi:hypothetical protein